MAQIVECLRGLGDACRALDYPIVSGTVSLYNESKATGGGSAILPTPAIGGVGLMDDHEKMATIGFKAEGEMIVLLCHGQGHLGQSLWLRELHGREEGDPPQVNLSMERATAELVRGLVADGLVSAVHDCADGGAAVAMAEMALAGGIGFTSVIAPNLPPLAGLYFGEDQGRYLVTAKDMSEIAERARQVGIAAVPIGQTGGQACSFRKQADGSESRVTLTALREASDSFFRDWMEG